MADLCYICNDRASFGTKTSIDIFNKSITLQSGKKLVEVLSELLDVTVTNDVHSKSLCKKCFVNCSEYDSMQVRIKNVKSDFIRHFKATLPKHKLNYETYNKQQPKKTPVPKKVLPDNKTANVSKKVVLPMSKLQPLPADFVLNLNNSEQKKSILGNKLKSIAPRQIELKATIGTSVLTRSIITSTAKDPVPTQLSFIKEPASDPTTQLSFIKEDVKYPTTQLSLSKEAAKVSTTQLSLVKEVKKEVTFLGQERNKEVTQKVLFEVNGVPVDFLRENDAMEIDEECSISVIPVSSENEVTAVSNIQMENASSSKTGHLTEVSLASLSDGQNDSMEKEHEYYIVGDKDDDDDEQTIVMNSGDGSVLRVLSSGELRFHGGALQLVMDERDSNDESQIELQVSGDEETANAIIAAAQEQGGAFIKVESGEMYRVKSVQSKSDDEVSDKVEPGSVEELYVQIEQEDGLYKCILCANSDKKDIGEYRGDATFIMSHLKRRHDARIYVCRACGLVVRKKSAFLKHCDEHINKDVDAADKTKTHECDTCGKKYSSRTLLREHANTHTGERPHTCETCNKTFASKYTYRNHLRTHTERPRPHACALCPKAFLTVYNLAQHVKTHSGVKDFICNVCGKAFGSQHNLEVHRVVHSGARRFACAACRKQFARRNELADHVRTHTGERPYACDTCGARFAQRSNLHSHRRATHLNDRRYHCTLCTKKFKRRRLLDFHTRSAHTGSRDLKCPTCGAGFVYPEHLKKHLRIHSGEKPYECEVCGKRFNARDNRNVHRFMHSDKKPYECVACGAGFMRKQLLLQHMISSGHISESIVINQPRVAKLGGDMFKTEVDAETTTVATTTDGEKFILQEDGKMLTSEMTFPSEMSLATDDADPLLALETTENQNKHEITTLDGITTEMLTDETQSILAPTEDGSYMRLVPIQLDDGNTGWIALPPE